MVECPVCSETIPEDSNYCDQCGKELMICPECEELGDSKFCTNDGTELITKRSMKRPETERETGSKEKPADKKAGGSLSMTTVTSSTRGASQVDIQESSKNRKIQLINETLGLKLEVEDGDILGRSAGPHQEELSDIDTISGKHAKIYFDENQDVWKIKDLHSTNGTRIRYSRQGEVIQVNQGVDRELEFNSYLYLANVELLVHLEGD